MAIRVLVAAFAVAARAELHCIGRAAHEVLESDQEGSWVVQPTPSRDAECASYGGPAIHGDRHLCVGANHDKTCAAAKQPVIPFPYGTRCQGCFVGAATDVFYSLNITRFHVEQVGIGFRGTQLRSTLQIEDDEGSAGRPRKGSKTFGEEPLEFKLKLGRFQFDLKVGMPTEVYYEMEARQGAHDDLGAILSVDMGDNYVEYVKGKGWSHHKDTAKVALKPIHEGDYDALANLTLGIKSSLQAELGKMAWFHMNISSEVPLGVSSVGTSGAELIHTCLDLGLKLDVGHEAEVDARIIRENFTRHWGPTIDRHRDASVFHKCHDVHAPKAEGVTLMV